MVVVILGNLRNDDEGTTTTLHIRGRLDRGFGFRRENLKVKRTILREDDGILGHYRSILFVYGVQRLAQFAYDKLRRWFY